MQAIDNFIVKSMRGDLRQGGTLVTALIEGETDALEFGHNVRLVGKAYADFDDMAYREIFNGHVLKTPPFSFETYTSQADISLGTANYLMRAGALQDIAFTEQSVPANDHQIAPTMRISSCFSHIVESHCNFIYNATSTPDGIIFSQDIDTSDTAIARLNIRKSNNFWNVLMAQLGGGEEGGVQFYRPYLRRNNELVYQAAPLFLASPPTAKGTLTKDHIRGTVKATIHNADEDRVGQAQIVAVQSSNQVLEAKYPATQPCDGKIIVKDRGIWSDSQARADTLAQNLYEWLTRPYTLNLNVDPGLILFGDDGQGLDIGDRVTVTYDGPAEDSISGAGVHLALNAQDFWVYKYGITYDWRTKTGTGTLELEADN